ncbi:RluA family pseudouridine synthase [Chitinimonas arctica]|uniref:Pseudouridine synthase n=1 Tax=Chitinimonas arctica TaxID=2594795 RepID=A0A516SJ42_9NEIS|nr:RluA family pseudouridine synthase [Chitinimonas arctica]QDQ28179.1 RluA family pseudouridine synthase [Chitinimonas arctica]
MHTPSKVSYLTVGAEEAGQRLDNYLLKCLKGAPKSLVYRIVRSGEVRVNSGRTDVTYRIVEGDHIRIPPIRLAEPGAPPSPAALARGAVLPILFEDDALLVIDKPAGMAVHGGSGISFGVIEQLRAQRPQAKFLELVHRLDRETSGILLVAKKRSALVAMHEMLRDDRSMDKRYLTLVKGVFPDARRHVRFKLQKYVTADGERRVSVTPEGQESHTILNRRSTFSEATLLECELKTGRTHQIRVHCAQSGFPILGDDKYGDFTLNKALPRQGLKRMFLHAWRLTLQHPLDRTPLKLESPLPTELQSYLDSLEKLDG